MRLTQVSTSERLTCFIGFPAKGTDLAASDIASTVPGAQTWRADHSPKNAANAISPDCGSAYVPVTTAEVTWSSHCCASILRSKCRLTLTTGQDAAGARSAVADGRQDAAVVDGTTIMLSLGEPDRTLAGILQSAHQEARLLRNLAQAGLNADQVRAATTIESLRVSRLDPGATDERTRQGLALVLMVSLLMLLMTSALGVAIGVVEQKGHRIVEILLIALRPGQLLAGKLLAFGALGAIQLATFAAAGLISAKAVGLTDDLPSGCRPSDSRARPRRRGASSCPRPTSL